MRFLTLAARNVLRNPRRTLLILSAVTAGVAALVFSWAMFDGQNVQMIRNMTDNFSSHAQGQKHGYLDNPSFDLTFMPQEAEAIANHPEVVAVSRRVSGGGLLSAGAATRGVSVVGVDPAAELKVTTLHQRMVQGKYFTPGQRGGLVLGMSLAKGLGVGIGDQVAVIVEGMQASIGAQRFQVLGIYDSGDSMIDSQQAFIALDDAFDLFATGGRVTALALKLRTLDDAATLQASLAGDLTVQGWRALLPEIVRMVGFHNLITHVIMTILFFIVALGIAGTLQMAVAERIREFGMQLAIGTSPWQVCRTILYEGFWITGSGFAVGYAISAAVVVWLGMAHIDFAPHIEGAVKAMPGAPGRATAYLEPARIVTLALGMLIVAFCAAIVPAVRAARLAPIAALRGSWGGREGAGRWRGSALLSRWPTWALAMRNMLRAPLRSALGLTALAFGLGAFIFIAAFAEGFLAQMVENTTGLVTGDVQIQHADFRFDMRPDLSFAATPAWLAQVRALPEVAAASLRVQTAASVGSSRKAEPVTLLGIDPQQEQQVTSLQGAVRSGRFLQNDRDILIGKKLAKKLDARIGEKIVVVAQDKAGNLGSNAYVVAGILDTGTHGPDSGMAYISLSSAQQLLGMKDSVSSVVIRLRDRKQMAPALARLTAGLPAGSNLAAITWDQLVPEIAQASSMVRHSLGMILAVVFLMVVIVVLNTLLMSVFSRAKEFGTLLAIGADTRMIVRMVMAEAGVLGVAGVAVGIAAGGALAWHYAVAGLVLTAHGPAELGVGNVVYPVLSAGLLGLPALLLFVLVLIASIYPARKIARLNPVEAIRRD